MSIGLSDLSGVLGGGEGGLGGVMGGLVAWSMSRMRLSRRASRMCHRDQDVAVRACSPSRGRRHDFFHLAVCSVRRQKYRHCHRRHCDTTGVFQLPVFVARRVWPVCLGELWCPDFGGENHGRPRNRQGEGYYDLLLISGHIGRHPGPRCVDRLTERDRESQVPVCRMWIDRKMDNKRMWLRHTTT